MAIPKLNLSDWSVMAPGPRESLGLASFESTVPYIGPWSQRIVFAEAMIGFPYYSKLIDDGTPDSRFGASSVNAPVGVSAEIEGVGAISARTDQYAGISMLESFEKAIVRVHYALPSLGTPYVSIGDERGRGDKISENFEPNGEFETLAKDNFLWEDDEPLIEGEEPGRPLFGIDYVFTRHEVNGVNPQVMDLVNHVNSTALTPISPIISHIALPPETVLFRSWSISASRSSTRGVAALVDVTMRFGIRKIPDPANPGAFTGWNHGFRGKLGRWLRMKRKESGNQFHYNFQLADLSIL